MARHKHRVTPTVRKPELPEVCPDCGYSPAKAAEFNALAKTYEELNDPSGPYGGHKLPPADRERYNVLGSENREWQTCGQAELHQQLDRRAAGEGHDEEDAAVDDEEEGGDPGEGNGDADAREAEGTQAEG